MTLGTAMSTFTYRPTSAIVDHDPDGPLVLVADDHEDSRFICRLVLESAGFRVAEARDGREALTMARVHQPALVVLDIVMPELTGWEVARTLRADHRSPRPAIIAVTALSGLSDREMSLAAGCDDMLVKPVHPRALVHVVRRYVSSGVAPHSTR
jgi:CheY-like chemotaxis protein